MVSGLGGLSALSGIGTASDLSGQILAIPNLTWWDSEINVFTATGNNAASVGENVGSWVSKSANALNLTGTGSLRPVLSSASQLNGKNTIYFDGVNDTLSGGNIFNSSQFFSFTVVFRFPSIIFYGVIFARCDNTGNVQQYRLSRFSNNDQVSLFANIGGTDQLLNSNNLSLSNYLILSGVIDSGQSPLNFYKNGSLAGSPTFNPTGNIAANSGYTFFVGSMDPVSTTPKLYSEMHLRHLFIKSGIYSEAERNLIEQYCSLDTGIAI